MRSRSWRLLVVCAAAATGVAAQGVIVPAAMQGVEGGSSSSIPFGSNQGCRYQCLYDASELPWSGPRLFTGISLRADNGSSAAPGQPMAQKGYVEVSVLVSTTYREASTMSSAFRENYGADATWVVRADRIMLPAQPAAPLGPRAANIDLVFATPWWFGLTPARPNQPPPANLLVEIWITSQPAGAYRLDNISGCASLAADFGNQGSACQLPNQPNPVLGGDPSMLAGYAFSWYLDHGAPNAPFMLVLAPTNVGNLFGQVAMPLPYPLFDPADPTQPAPGLAALRWPAPGCWMNVDPLAGLIGTCDATGRGVVTTSVPAGRQNVGTTIFGQALALAPTANQLGVVTTRGRRSTVCGPLGAARLHAYYNSAGSPPPPDNGTLSYGAAMIIEVR